ncbi:hypothetical protein EZS27_007360 [termite gut metagenome]|uniref:Uncharacterized protein n=1 Tax=termite gut metagenome TaxID=433724 RepID=A0A5J4SFX6_9ZZZZ
MKEIKIYFTDFWSSFVVEESFIYQYLSLYYKVIITPTPNYLFYSCGGFRHLKYNNCIKIFYTGENMVPDFNLCDYGIGFQHLQFEDRFIRFPLFLTHKNGWEELKKLESKENISPHLANRKFCNFVYSNGKESDPLRELFFHELSRYKKVDSGGRYLNNIGRAVIDKLDFIKEYKFTIAMENSSLSGYTTEKIIDSMRVNSIPVYYGDPNIAVDFNLNAIIHVKDKHSIKQAIEEVIYLDNDDTYTTKLAQPWFSREHIKDYYDRKLYSFFDRIFEQPLESAYRTTNYAWAGYYKQTLSHVCFLTKNYFFNKTWGAIDRLKKIHEKIKS